MPRARPTVEHFYSRQYGDGAVWKGMGRRWLRQLRRTNGDIRATGPASRAFGFDQAGSHDAYARPGME